jgi:hypothetical protein
LTLTSTGADHSGMRSSSPTYLLAAVALGAGCGPSSLGRDDDPQVDAGPAPVDAAPAADSNVVDPPPPATDVEVVITADNAYSFGYGDVDGIATFIQGSRAQSAGQIFNCGEGPEAYLVPAADAPSDAYLYIATWDDLAITQGVLGQFKRTGGGALYTGDPLFEVCATGITPADAINGPSQVDINAQIAICNAGSGSPDSTSSGWVNTAGAVTPDAVGVLVAGESNSDDGGTTFPLTCPTGSPTEAPTIDGEAHWMWYSPTGGGDAFHSTGSNTFRAYLIFRVAAEDLPDID